MEQTLRYRAEDFSATLPLADYLARFRDAARIGGYCRSCPRYGATWACPPFEFEVESLFEGRTTALIIATRITPAEAGAPLAAAREVIRPERLRLERQLLELEHRVGGRAFTCVGECFACPGEPCTRPEGLPCRHPERVRPSLEACGFDLERTASKLFGIEMRWGRNGLLPEYLTLVCGLFHSQPADAVRW